MSKKSDQSNTPDTASEAQAVPVEPQAIDPTIALQARIDEQDLALQALKAENETLVAKVDETSKAIEAELLAHSETAVKHDNLNEAQGQAESDLTDARAQLEAARNTAAEAQALVKELESRLAESRLQVEQARLGLVNALAPAPVAPTTIH